MSLPLVCAKLAVVTSLLRLIVLSDSTVTSIALAAGQAHQARYRAAQDQAYEDLATRLGRSERDAAISSFGRLGALSGQRARQIGEQDRAAREAAGALAAEALQYGDQRADADFGRIGQRLSGASTAGDVATRAATQDIAGHLGALKGQQADISGLQAAEAAQAGAAKGALHDAAVRGATAYITGGASELGNVGKNRGGFYLAGGGRYVRPRMFRGGR